MVPRSRGRERGGKGLTELETPSPSYTPLALGPALSRSSMLGFLRIHVYKMMRDNMTLSDKAGLGGHATQDLVSSAAN